MSVITSKAIESNEEQSHYIVYNKSWERKWDLTSRFYPVSDRGTVKLQFSIRP